MLFTCFYVFNLENPPSLTYHILEINSIMYKIMNPAYKRTRNSSNHSSCGLAGSLIHINYSFYVFNLENPQSLTYHILEIQSVTYKIMNPAYRRTRNSSNHSSCGLAGSLFHINYSLWWTRHRSCERQHRSDIFHASSKDKVYTQPFLLAIMDGYDLQQHYLILDNTTIPVGSDSIQSFDKLFKVK